MLGAPVDELHSAIETMLRKALRHKVNRVKNWNGRFSECWILILNMYVLVGDPDEVREVLRDLVRSDPALAQIEGVFWSGYPDRSLIEIRFG